eukprot:TRINITY_DN39942_c0_g1_i1.p2 TRINITY_DN39942_c0_g1~~TRINITY_DN39942_c0_g1_i1.p2  ORF type:complete len:270 (+),score=43.62 TRINITY_DN39942_c0_g1_i1:90-899(+)
MAVLQLYIRSPSRPDTVSLEVGASATVGELKAAAAAALQIPQARLLWQGTELNDASVPLADVGLSNECELGVQEGGVPVRFDPEQVGRHLQLDSSRKYCRNMEMSGHSFCFTEANADVPPAPAKLNMGPMTLFAEHMPDRAHESAPPIWGIGILPVASGWRPSLETGNNSCTGACGILFISNAPQPAKVSVSGRYEAHSPVLDGLPTSANWEKGDAVTITVVEGIAVLAINGERRAAVEVPVGDPSDGRCPRMGLAVSIFRGGAWRAAD